MWNVCEVYVSCMLNKFEICMRSVGKNVVEVFVKCVRKVCAIGVKKWEICVKKSTKPLLKHVQNVLKCVWNMCKICVKVFRQVLVMHHVIMLSCWLSIFVLSHQTLCSWYWQIYRHIYIYITYGHKKWNE